MPVNEKERQSAGDCIRQLREEKGYNIDSLAGLLLLTPKQLTGIETGRATPDGMTLALAGYVFGVIRMRWHPGRSSQERATRSLWSRQNRSSVIWKV